MNFHSRAFSPEDEGKLRKLTFLRLVVATLVIGAAIVVLQFEARTISVAVLYGLLGAIYLITSSVYLAFRAGIALKPLLWLQIYLDFIVLSFIVHYSGGTSSYFTILYILPIIAAGAYFQVPGGVISAVSAISIYIFYAVIESSGFIGSRSVARAYSSGGYFSLLLKGYLQMVLFLFTGLLTGYVSRIIKSKGEELAFKEKELKRVQLDTDNIIRNMSSGLIVTNMSGEIISINPAGREILGIGDEELEGKLIDDAIPHMHPLLKELSSVIETGTPKRRHEVEVVKPDGTILPLGISITFLRGDAGERRGIIALFQDLTEVKRMRERVRKADRMAAVGELSAAIAHEIRAPLASICGSIQMLSEDLEVTGEQRCLMDLIIKESDRLDRIITDFLEYARLKSPELTTVDLFQCINEVILLLRHSSNVSEGIDINFDERVKGVKLYADEEQIKEVFLNIGLNACEAMGGTGRLTIRVDLEDGKVDNESRRRGFAVISFTNDGPPIPDEVRPRIFEPFYTTKEGGTGLGLSIAARIIESHSGMIKVESDAGNGTTFFVYLPVFTGLDAREKLLVEEEFVSF